MGEKARMELTPRVDALVIAITPALNIGSELHDIKVRRSH
jgi:hypothetical protein